MFETLREHFLDQTTFLNIRNIQFLLSKLFFKLFCGHLRSNLNIRKTQRLFSLHFFLYFILISIVGNQIFFPVS